MKEVFRNADSAWVGLYQSMLEDAGIPTFVYNLGALQMPAAGLAVALWPLPIFFPTLCVLDDADYPEAMQILASLRTNAHSNATTKGGNGKEVVMLPEWTCVKCGETVPDNFTDCWRCSTARPLAG